MNKTTPPHKLRPTMKVPKKILLPEEKIPLWSFIFLGLFVLSLILVLIAKASPSFADFFNRNISGVLRVILAFLTNMFPFSVAEFLILMIPVVLLFVIRYAIRHKSKSWRSVFSYAVSLCSAVSLLFSLFVWVYGIGYHTPELDERLSLENQAVSATELADTAKNLISDMEDCLIYIRYTEDGSSLMPYSLSEMNDKLTTAFKELAKQHPFLQDHKSRVKPVLLSVPMSYAHLTGVYTFFTGESNLNVDFPDYTLPFTAAHELAHGRGIARENEANFIAFLTCIGSDDVYLRYCGFVNMYEYIASALYEADEGENKPLYNEVTSLLDKRVLGELKAYSAFFQKYRDSRLSEVSGNINDSFLKANGTEEGEKSYGLVVNLTVSYYKEK
ncbi:MAG: DUF3810 domain-containing protein [Clostridia bacterium]|nr:DUF3810 domain-containing protein [Clostridia bacterium]